MRSILSKEQLKPATNPSKSRSITYSQKKESKGIKSSFIQCQEISKTKPKLKARPKSKDNLKQIQIQGQKEKQREKQSVTIVKRQIKDDKLRSIMISTLDLLKTSDLIESQHKTNNHKQSKQLIDMAQDIHSLVQIIVKDKAAKRSQSFITDRQKSLNKQSLLKYFQTKLCCNTQDQIEKKLRNLQGIKRSQGIMQKYQSQSIQDSDFDKQNYESVSHQRRILKNILSKRDFNV